MLIKRTTVATQGEGSRGRQDARQVVRSKFNLQVRNVDSQSFLCPHPPIFYTHFPFSPSLFPLLTSPFLTSLSSLGLAQFTQFSGSTNWWSARAKTHTGRQKHTHTHTRSMCSIDNCSWQRGVGGVSLRIVRALHARVDHQKQQQLT